VEKRTLSDEGPGSSDSAPPPPPRPARPADPRKRRRALLIALVGVLVLAGVAAFGARTRPLVATDPRFCASACHHELKGASEGWHAKGHDGVACQKCHEVSFKVGASLWWKSLIGGKPASHAKAEAPACVECHEKDPAKWLLIDESAGHRKHRSAKDVSCLSCHGATTHTSTPSEKTCFECHKTERLHKAAPASAESCFSCHRFAVSDKLAEKNSIDACGKCHQSTAALEASTTTPLPKPLKEVNDQALHGKVPCQLCHDSHGKKPKPPKEGQPVCARCHEFQIKQIGAEVKKELVGHRDCEGCHQPHAPLHTAQDRCVKCHEKNAKGIFADGKTDKTAPDGKTTALKHKSCASCHQPHTWRADKNGCQICHKDRAQMVATRSPSQHGSCTNCHEVHGPPPTGAVCVKCHEKTKGTHVALAPAKHKDCASCHNPHAPSPKETRDSCGKCHQTELAQVSKEGPVKHTLESCFSCHKPHENPAAPKDVCAKCHADKARLASTARPAKHQVCTECHEKHVFKVKDAQATCLACHGAPKAGATNAKAGGAPVLPASTTHGGDCKKCHAPHGPPTVQKAACFKCHDKLEAGFKPVNEQHGTCRSCHTPHMPAKGAGEKCAGCHAPKVAIAAKWPAGSPHAQACVGCHTPHDVKAKKACATCHTKEATSATGGKHQCVQCHAPHVAPPGTGAAWWSKCNECHSAKVESVKLQGKTHSQCKSCHEPHKFAVPACTTCHAEQVKKGLHTSPKHAASCKSCHDPHVKAEPTRDQCLACHTDKRAHQPDAKKCQACHVFK
jgi:hypothetical protein